MKKNESLLQALLRLPKTVFSFNEIALLCPIDTANLRSQLSYYVKKGYLYHIKRGLYAKDANYNRYEVATKIFTPSYISFETVLRHAGLIFQYYTTIYIASYRSETVVCDGQEYNFRTLKPSILTGTEGILIQDTYSIATPERAFLDMLYAHPEYYFDNLRPLNWEKVYLILPLYRNQRLEHDVAIEHRRYIEEA